MKEKLCLFAGTTEGRRLADLLHGEYDLTVCVATEYGEILLDGIPEITVRPGRMDEAEMEAFFREGGFDLIVDATHPYADLVTENIRIAAEKTSLPLLRVLRESEPASGRIRYAASAEEAADFLASHEGNILLTTGSKDLPAYAGLDKDRLWVRVLPAAASLESCAAIGLAPSHILAVQGPFSKEMNLAMLKMCGARFMVTKDSGRTGGFLEKLEAAAEAGVRTVIIGRPPQTEGVTFEEAVRRLSRCREKARIDLIGLGPGGRQLLTAEAKEALRNCDAVIGAASVTALLEGTEKPVFHAFQPEAVRNILEEHPSFRRVCVVMRGDTGFFSGAKKLTEALGAYRVELLPGISSVALLAARLEISWDDAALLSLHGREGFLIQTVLSSRKTFVLTGGQNSVSAICERLCEYGLGGLAVTVGENLSLPEERIVKGTAETLRGTDFASLSLLYIDNPAARRPFRVGIPDEEFIRGDVPMTKSEVRAVSLSHLAPEDGAVIYDIGAGTGSVAIECALNAPHGIVYAVEKKAEAVQLIEQNRKKFAAENLTVIEGGAPEALKDLPAPDCAFIGGSSGNLKEIVQALLDKNPAVRIVINTVTLETFAEALAVKDRFGFETFSCVTVSITRSRPVGRYQMQTAQNPVQVITLQKKAQNA